MKWYVSGPMTGYDDLNFPAFKYATTDLRNRGHEVISPAEHNPDPNASWLPCILEDIQLVSTCDAMLMLKGWEDSYGAKIEHLVAQKLQLHIEYEESND
jgi:hypothetical protein